MRQRRFVPSIWLFAAACLLLVTCKPPEIIGAFTPRVVYDSANQRYFSVYLKRTAVYGDGPGSRVYGQFISNTGALQGSEFVISESSDYRCPSLAYDGIQARFFAVWSTPGSLVGQIINADGTPNGPLLTISDTLGYSDWRCSAVSYDEAHGVYLVAWGETQPENHDNVHAQIISVDGTLVGPKLLLSDAGACESHPALAYDRLNQRFFAVWESMGLLDIRGRIINADGSFEGPEIGVFAAGQAQGWPSVTRDDINGRFLVAWEQQGGTGNWSLDGQLMDSDGSPYQAPFTISDAGRNVSHHAGSFDGASQRYFLVFGDARVNNERIYGQRVTADGTLDQNTASGNILISHPDFPGERHPSLAFDGASGRYLAVWVYGLVGCEYEAKEKYADIHGRLINTDGSPAGETFIVSNGGRW